MGGREEVRERGRSKVGGLRENEESEVDEGKRRGMSMQESEQGVA